MELDEHGKTPSGLVVPESYKHELSKGGVFLPEGVPDIPPETGEQPVFLPPGVPEPGQAPPGELEPKDFAKKDCRFCNGKGLVPTEDKELRATKEVLCPCVEKRLASGHGPRSKRGKAVVKSNNSSQGEKA